jgi:leucyl aminopeptidase
MIRFDTTDGRPNTLPADCLVIGLFDEDALSGVAASINTASRGKLKQLKATGDLSTKLGETALLHELVGIRASRLLVVGLGKRTEFNQLAWRKAHLAALTASMKTRAAHSIIAIESATTEPPDAYYQGRTISELVGQAEYRINDLKTARKPPKPAQRRVTIANIKPADRAAVRRGVSHGEAISAGQNTLRDLGNLPGNICTPRYLAACARALGKTHRGLKVKVLEEPQIKRLKMGCLLAVSRGSAEPPRFIVMEHRGAGRNAAPIVLVGKGVTFDTGGISLKDPSAMDEMKYDMCGAGSVLAVMQVAALLKLRLNIIGLVAAVENMPSDRATKPGDIVFSAAGKSVEILNTDAEGRLILCDALHYARRYDPAVVIDIATLTGACVVALGHHHSGVMANHAPLAKELVEAGLRAHDRAWQLPLTDDYGEQLRSNFADLANVGGRDGGAITAAAFLSRFTQGMNWAHLDIAGTAWLSGAQKGGTGRPVGLLSDFLIHRANSTKA